METLIKNICIKHAIEHIETIQKDCSFKKPIFGGLDLLARWDSDTKKLKIQIARNKTLLFEKVLYEPLPAIENPNIYDPLSTKILHKLRPLIIKELQKDYLDDAGWVQEERFNFLWGNQMLWESYFLDVDIEMIVTHPKEEILLQFYHQQDDDRLHFQTFSTYYNWNLQEVDSVEDKFFTLCEAIEDLEDDDLNWRNHTNHSY